MKTPPSTINAKGELDKGTVNLCSAHHPKREEKDAHLQEFGVEIDGTTTTCYVLTTPGDIIEVDYAFNAGIVGFIDFVVDGVRRKTVVGRAGSLNRGTIDRGLSMARGKDGKRAGLKHCHMQLKLREQSDDEISEDMNPSAVGSIMLQIFQKRLSTTEEDENAPLAQRYPDFEERATWMETSNHNIFHGDDIPTLSIDMIEPTRVTKPMKDQAQKVWGAEYKLVCTFVFLLRTADELRAMGKFADVPDYTAPPYTPAVSAPKKGKGRPGKPIAESESGKTPDADDDAEIANENEPSSPPKAKLKAKSAPKAKKTASKENIIKKDESGDEKDDESKAEVEDKSVLVKRSISSSPEPSVAETDDEKMSDVTGVSENHVEDLDTNTDNIDSIYEPINQDASKGPHALMEQIYETDLPISTTDTPLRSTTTDDDDEHVPGQGDEKQARNLRAMSERVVPLGESVSILDSVSSTVLSKKRSRSESELHSFADKHVKNIDMDVQSITPIKNKKPNSLMELPNSPATFVSFEQEAGRLIGHVEMRDKAWDTEIENSTSNTLRSVAGPSLVEAFKSTSTATATVADLIKKDNSTDDGKTRTSRISEASTDIETEMNSRREVEDTNRSEADTVSDHSPALVTKTSTSESIPEPALGRSLTDIKIPHEAPLVTGNLHSESDNLIKQERRIHVQDFQSPGTPVTQLSKSRSLTASSSGRKCVSFSPEAEVFESKSASKGGKNTSRVVTKTEEKSTTPSKTVKSSGKSKSAATSTKSSLTAGKKSTDKVTEKTTDKRKAVAEADKSTKKRKTSASTDTKATVLAPPGRERIENELEAAQARVDAAATRKRELMVEYENALALKAQLNKKVKEKIEEAEELEREVAEWEAKIAAVHE